MANQIETEPEASVATLIGGIAQDARVLFLQQMALFQVEFKNELHRTITALIPLFAGAGVMCAGVLLLGFGSGYFLSWVAEIPLWIAFAIVGVVTAAIGALVFWAKFMLDKINPIPDTALTGLKENIQWKTKK